MPRQSRIDAPGALHHIIVRGIERCKIFKDFADRISFIERFGKIIGDTETTCYAWALIPNHFHLLLKTGSVPISNVMRRLLTGYAISHNRRHRRQGHLFQNRYKSILCEEDAYLKELVRYIHLNPLRAGIVKDLTALDKYPYTGHSTIMGRKPNTWQDVENILGLFSDDIFLARQRYRAFIKYGINQGKRSEFAGGGLIRSAGGWKQVKALRKAKDFYKSDERILGSSDFVKSVLKRAQESMESRYQLAAKGVSLDRIIRIVADYFKIKSTALTMPGKERIKVQARSLLCFWAVHELGMNMTELSKRLNISVSAVSVSVQRGEKIVNDNSISLLKLLKQ